MKIPKNIKHIINDIIIEKQKQLDKWGEQNHPILDSILIERDSIRMCEEYHLPSEIVAKQNVDINAKRNTLTYMHILVEEVAEAASCKDNIENLRNELIQIATVAISMVESLEKNKK
jgi:hypothetical protein